MPKCSFQLQLQKWAPQDAHTRPRCDADHALPFLSVARHHCGSAEPGVPFPEVEWAAQADQCCAMEVPWLGLEGSGSLSGEGSRHQLWCPTQLWSPWYKGTWQATESDPRRSSREVTQTAAVSGTANENHARFLDFSNRSLNTPGWKIHEQKKSLYPGFQSEQSLTAL